MDRRIKDTFEPKTIDPTGVCEKCTEKYLKEGVLLINPKNCNLVVLRDEAFEATMNVPIPPKKIAFCDQELLDKIQEEANQND